MLYVKESLGHISVKNYKLGNSLLSVFDIKAWKKIDQSYFITNVLLVQELEIKKMRPALLLFATADITKLL